MFSLTAVMRVMFFGNLIAAIVSAIVAIDSGNPLPFLLFSLNTYGALMYFNALRQIYEEAQAVEDLVREIARENDIGQTKVEDLYPKKKKDTTH